MGCIKGLRPGSSLVYGVVGAAIADVPGHAQRGVQEHPDVTGQVASYEFTTLTCIPGVVRYRGAKIQLLDLPGIIEGAKDGKGRGRQVRALPRVWLGFQEALLVRGPRNFKRGRRFERQVPSKGSCSWDPCLHALLTYGRGAMHTRAGDQR